MPEVEYVNEEFMVLHEPVPRRGILQLAPGQGVMGYGKKISTDRMVRFKGEHTRYRVYCVCYSNSSSLYIIRHGRTLYFRSSDLY